jgi:hypothetical protein
LDLSILAAGIAGHCKHHWQNKINHRLTMPDRVFPATQHRGFSAANKKYFASHLRLFVSEMRAG